MTGSLFPMIAAAVLAAAAAQPVAVDVRPIDRAVYARMLAGMKGRPVVVNEGVRVSSASVGSRSVFGCVSGGTNASSSVDGA